MNKITIIYAICLVFMITVVGTAFSDLPPATGVTGSLHDITFMSKVTGYYNADQSQRVCIFCHTSETSPTTDNATNHERTSLLPLPYQWATPANTPITIKDPLTGQTGQCLGCHDGVTAVDAHGGTGQSNNGQHVMAGPKVINDLTVTHPVGFLYDDAIMCRNTDPYKPGIVTPDNYFLDRVLVGTAASSNDTNNSQRAASGWTYTYERIGDKLFQGTMTCATCHDVHNTNNSPNDPAVDVAGNPFGGTPNNFLWAREQGSALCLTCHVIQGTSGSTRLVASTLATSSTLSLTMNNTSEFRLKYPETGVNGSVHDINYLAATGGYYNQDQYQRVCIFCHTPHNAMTAAQTGGDPAPLWNHQVSSLINPLPYRWASSANADIQIIDPLIGPTRLCLGCHDGLTPVDAHGGFGTANNGNHVMKGSKVVNDFTTTHPVGFRFSEALAKGSNLRPGLSHNTPFSYYFNPRNVTIGSRLYQGDIMTCSTCHEVHNANNAVQYDPVTGIHENSLLIGEYTPSRPDLCLTCHVRVDNPYAHKLERNVIIVDSGLSGTVTDSTGNPLPGSTVTIGTQTATVDQTGKYIISPLAPGTYTVTVSKDGYTSLSDTVVITSGVQSIKNFKLHLVSANDPLVVSIDSKINGFAYYLVGPTFPVDFTATVSWGTHPPGKVRFITSTTSYEVPTLGPTALITLDMGREFYACSTLKVVAVSRDGTTSSEKSADFVVMDPPLGGLEFIPVDEGDRFFYRTGKGMAVSLFDLKLDNGRIPNNIPVLGGNSFKFSLAPKMTWNTYSTGVTDLALEADELLNISLAGLDLTLTPRVKATGAYHHPGCYRVWSGEVGAEFGVGFEKSTPFILPGPIPMPMYWKVGVRIDGEVMAGIENLNPVRLNYSGDIAPALRGALGVGADQKFSAEGWLKGSSDFLLQYPQEPHLKDVLVNIDAGITAYCLGMTWEFNALHWDWEMNGAASLSAASLLTPAMIQQASGPSLLPRDYLKIQGSGVLQRKSTPKLLSLMTDGQAYAVTTSTLASATLPYSETRLSSSGDKMSLLYISDNPSRSAINRSMAVFTRYDGGTWGIPQPLNDDGTADFHPSAVTFSDGTVVATWEDEKIVQPDAASFDDLVKNLEISAGVYNPVAGTWQTMRLSENGFIDASPLVSGFSRDNVLLVWLANTANNLTGSSAQPNIIRFSRYNGVTWSAPQDAGSIPYGLVKYSLAYDGGKGWVVLSLDTDGDPATINDHELFVMTFDNGLWSGLTRLTTNTVPDDNPQQAFDPAGNLVLTWLQGAEVSSTLNLDLAQRTVIRAEQEYSSNLADFKLATTPDGKVALTWAQPSPTNSSDLFAAFYDPIFRKWGAPRQMTSDPETERQITATFSGPETFMAVYNKTLLGPPPVAPTDLVMITHTLGTDLGLDPTGFTATPSNPAPGESVTLRAKAMNQGDKPLNNITVAFYNGDPATGTKLGETIITEVMAPGDTRDVTFAWTIPPTTTPLTIFAVIDPDSALDPVNRSNNSASLTIVKPDLTVATVSWEKPADDIAVVIARIANTGSLPTPVTAVSFRNGSPTGTVLYTTDIPGLGPGAALDVEYVWDLATFTAPYHTAFVTVDEANVVAESDETDNSGSVTFPGKQQDLMEQVSVSRAGTGGGRVTSSPVGVDCGTTCSGTFVWNTPVSLAATPDQYSFFSGWTGVGACSTGSDCVFTITDPAAVTAAFTLDAAHSVRVDGTPQVFHPSLQSAFDKAASGAVVRAWAVPFTGGITLNNPVALKVYGGYDASYNTRPGYTTINGKLTISKGGVVVDRIIVK